MLPIFRGISKSVAREENIVAINFQVSTMQLSYLIFGLAAICNMVSAFQMASMSRRPSILRSVVDDKAEVTEYFNNDGFSRWNKIYSESGEVNKVQLDIRTGHQITIDKVLNWMSDENNKAKSVCDAGCGVGSLALPMSKLYKKVSASDISSSMTKEAAARAKEAKLNNLDFKVADMETLGGKYNTVTCIDVMIHYPTDKVRSVVLYNHESTIPTHTRNVIT